MSDVTEINVETGEVAFRSYTNEEIQNINNLEAPEAPFIEIAQLDENKISAIAKLQALGLTEEEARAIAGIGA
jgi:hypothetical protein